MSTDYYWGYFQNKVVKQLLRVFALNFFEADLKNLEHFPTHGPLYDTTIHDIGGVF